MGSELDAIVLEISGASPQTSVSTTARCNPQRCRRKVCFVVNAGLLGNDDRAGSSTNGLKGAASRTG